MVSDISAHTFHSEVLESPLPVLVEFWASWCLPCKMADPVLHALAKEFSDSVKVVKVNCDRNKGLAAEYNVKGLPTFILFVGARETARAVSSQTKNQLTSLIAQHISM